MAHPYLTGAPHPRVLAHRGLVTEQLAARGVVENSREAIACAVDAGADCIETDCRETLDGAVVLVHDADLLRVIGDPLSIAHATRLEIESALADRGGLLTLEQALADFPDTRFNVDIKTDAAAEAIGRVVAPHAERVLLTSFSDARRERAIAAALAAGARRPAASPGRNRIALILVAVALNARRWAARAFRGLDALQIPERYWRIRVLSPRLVRAAHAFGVEVHVWTINDPDRMRELIEMGVDGIVTDRADVALRALR